MEIVHVYQFLQHKHEVKITSYKLHGNTKYLNI